MPTLSHWARLLGAWSRLQGAWSRHQILYNNVQFLFGFSCQGFDDATTRPADATTRPADATTRPTHILHFQRYEADLKPLGASSPVAKSQTRPRTHLTFCIFKGMKYLISADFKLLGAFAIFHSSKACPISFSVTSFQVSQSTKKNT